MEILVASDYEALSDRAASLVLEAVRAKPRLVLGLAAGRTPLGLYRRLRAEGRLLRDVSFFALDEYLGAGPDDPRSFRRMLRESLLDPIANRPERARFLRGDAPDPEREAEDYERAIAEAGGIDLQLLGLGRNGHLAFNEPGSPLASRTRRVALAPDTPSPFRAPGGEAFALTMGLGTILEARRVLLLASGRAKAAAARRMAEGPVTPELPASALQLHPDAAALLDADAASALSPGSESGRMGA